MLGIPIQIINNRRLSVDENLWLKGLSDRLNALECLRVHTEIYRQKKAEYAGAFLNAIARANAQAVFETIVSATSLDPEKVKTLYQN